MTVALGTSWRTSISRVGARSAPNQLKPVTFEARPLGMAGRPRGPDRLPLRNTIGMVEVAVLAAAVARSLVVTIAATRRPTRSAASARIRLGCRSAERQSIVRLRPSA